jgi:hypothetical protein
MERALARTTFSFGHPGYHQPTESISYQSSEIVAPRRLAILEAHRMSELGDVIVTYLTRNANALGEIPVGLAGGVGLALSSAECEGTARILIKMARAIPRNPTMIGRPLPCKELNVYMRAAVEPFRGGLRQSVSVALFGCCSDILCHRPSRPQR